MPGFRTAKLFTHRRSQAVWLPREFRPRGSEVRVTRRGWRVILEPVTRDPADVASVFTKIDRLLEGVPFPQPGPEDDVSAAPDRRSFFDE